MEPLKNLIAVSDWKVKEQLSGWKHSIMHDIDVDYLDKEKQYKVFVVYLRLAIFPSSRVSKLSSAQNDCFTAHIATLPLLP